MIVINPTYAELGRNFAGTLKPFVTVKPQATALPSPFGIIDTPQLMKSTFELTWLVMGVLVKGQPAVIGGAQKTLKTSISIDLAVSLRTGTPFLGKFAVGKCWKVLVLSAESGEATLRNTHERVCTGKGIEDPNLPNLFWGVRVPSLSNAAQLKQLEDDIRQYQIDVVIIDPLYLCLCDQKQSAQAGNMFSMGPLLAALAKACLTAGATPIVVHHTRKQAGGKAAWAKFDPPELEDLAYSGVQQFFRQWMLIGRREPYDSEAGKHSLWFTYGGSAGHSDTWALDVSEGRMDGQFGNRSWKVRLRTRAQLTEETKEIKALRQAEQQRQNIDDAVKEVTRLLQDAVQPLTLSDLKDNMKVGKSRLDEALRWLMDQGQVKGATVKKRAGRGERDYDAFTWSQVSQSAPEKT